MEAGRIDPAHVRTITDALEIRRLLEQAADASARALIGVGGGDERHESAVLELDREQGFLLLRRPESLSARGASGRPCFVLIFARGLQALGFTAPVSSAREGVLRFALPAKAFQLQRRKDVRVEIPKGYDLAVKLHSAEARGKRIRRRLLDISAHGFSFLVTSAEEAARFAAGKFIRQVILEVHGRQIVFDAQIRNHFTLGAGRIKIGAQFLRVHPSDREFIEALCLTRLAPFVLDRGFGDPED
jgi:c-di-GMP-binding flagellar brake protein YcgR